MNSDDLKCIEILKKIRSNNVDEAMTMLTEVKNEEFIGLINQVFSQQTVKSSEVQATNSIFDAPPNYYSPALLNVGTVCNYMFSSSMWDELMSFHSQLASDPYVEYLDNYYREGRARFGEFWHYADIVTTLFSLSKMIQPRNYMEIGVRRGRSVCTVVNASPAVNVVAFDMWMQNYAGMENPGPEFVKGELEKFNHQGHVEFVNGNSHVTVPAYFEQNPDTYFDMITVDGDHSEEGAYEDLKTVITRLNIGGALIFDDIAHPSHPYLYDVWMRVMQEHPA